ncbi:hypothetical protein FPQ18DRAFT_334380 [Pyronema domesticum]|nr:hypothetical protein FPQ18DRAFT_334380 [Pyronema domesticum]
MYFGVTSHDVHDGHTHLEAPAIGISGDLFDLNCKLFRFLRRSELCSDRESDEAWLADNEAGRFRLWGDGFDAKEGGLHELLEHSSLGGTVVSLLVGVARKLQKYVPKDSELFKDVAKNAEKAEYIYPDAIEDDDDDEDVPLLEDLEDIKAFNDGLYELTPFLESIPVVYDQELVVTLPTLINPVTIEVSEAKALHVNIIDKFPEAAHNPELVGRLADTNLQRQKRLRELKATHEKEIETGDKAEDDDAWDNDIRSHAPSRTTNTTSWSRSSSLPSTADSLFSSYARSEASASSYSSVDLARVGRTDIPPPPVPLGEDVVFECNLCFQEQHHIQNKYLWKKHVFRDLQSYSCSFLHCPLPRTHLFSSRTEWIEHEFSVHRILLSWVCIKDCGQEFEDEEHFKGHLKNTHLGPTATDSEVNEITRKCQRQNPLPEIQKTTCPLCREIIPETRRSIRQHLGRHMEEISLFVVPPENYHGYEEEPESDGHSESSSEPETPWEMTQRESLERGMQDSVVTMREDALGAMEDIELDIDPRERELISPFVNLHITPTPTDFERANEEQPATTTETSDSSQPITRTITVPHRYHGQLIGSSGTTLQKLIGDAGGPVRKSEQSQIVNFPGRDSNSNSVVIRGNKTMVEEIIKGIKAKVESFEQKEQKRAGKGKKSMQGESSGASQASQGAQQGASNAEGRDIWKRS